MVIKFDVQLACAALGGSGLAFWVVRFCGPSGDATDSVADNCSGQGESSVGLAKDAISNNPVDNDKDIKCSMPGLEIRAHAEEGLALVFCLLFCACALAVWIMSGRASCPVKAAGNAG
ncbi:hypothetical protein ABBQ38_000335 [Trebouxia sp. C0009 RCD-2024]